MRILTILLFALSLPAQGFVSPAHFATVEATGNSALPFGQATAPLRYQQVHDGIPAQTITGLAFRHDTTGPLRPAFTVTVDVWLSTASAAAANTQASFAANHGPDQQQVIGNRTIAVPTNDPSRLPGDFLLDLPFDTGVSFAFAGNGASLCWEVQVTATSNTTNLIPFDAVLTQGAAPASPGLVGTSAFTGCIATGRTQPMRLAPANSPVDWLTGLATQRVQATSLQANGLIAWIVGTSTTTWSGGALPTLLPGTAGGSSGPCTLYCDPLLATAAVATAAGTATIQWSLTATPAAHGFLLPSQVVGLDAAANSLGLTTTNLVVQQLVAPYPADVGIRRVYALNLGPTGTVDGNSPLVTWFH